MNLVGKIFVVLIFVLSLVLMSLTVAVYMTHTNWYVYVNNTDTSTGYPLGLKPQMANLQEENANLRKAYATLVGDYEKSLQESTNAKSEIVAVKENQTKEVQELRETISSSYAEINTRLDDTHKALVTIASGHELLRDSIKTLQQEVTALSDKLSDRTGFMNEIAQLERRNRELASRNEDLKNENVLANEVLTYNNMVNDLEYYRTQTPPVSIQGRVIEQAGRKIRINVGSDDGIRPGHKFQLLSKDGTTYICDVEVENVMPDVATCIFSNLRSEQSINVIPGCIVRPL
ncbi:MAG: hypothetical protein IJD43_02620 [Thermoguttaceae bacterium]|nr:hypothetical protein [Planctomycetaceae bacterium]MBQ4142347.1 hypothetical protein [Thermoguttaceae bacterium]